MDTNKPHQSAETLLTVTSADGAEVRALDEGSGPTIIILHPGMETAERYAKVTAILRQRFRVIRVFRRQYRLDLKATPTTGSPCTVQQEVEDVLAVARKVGGHSLIYGHSSGGPVALEALVSAPELFVGGIIYEPASVIGRTGEYHLCGDYLTKDGEPGQGLTLCRTALVAGKPGKAIGIFTHYIAGWPGWVANLVGGLTVLFPAYRRLIPCQIDDLEAMERLGYRLDTYSRLQTPITLLNGDRSTAYNKQIVNDMLKSLVSAEHTVLHGQAHTAHVMAAPKLAKVISDFASRVLTGQTNA